MRVDVIMPQMGESIAEGTLTRWLRKPGEKVARDEPIFEISTDKVDAEIPSPAAGVLAEVRVKEGETVPVNTVVAQIETDATAAAGATPRAAAPAPSAPQPGPRVEHRLVVVPRVKPVLCPRQQQRRAALRARVDQPPGYEPVGWVSHRPQPVHRAPRQPRQQHDRSDQREHADRRG